MPNINTKIFRHAKTREEKERLKSLFIQILPTLEMTLVPVLQELIEKSYESIEKEDLYNKPHALHFMSDQNGYRRAIKEVLNLIGDKNA